MAGKTKAQQIRELQGKIDKAKDRKQKAHEELVAHRAVLKATRVKK